LGLSGELDISPHAIGSAPGGFLGVSDSMRRETRGLDTRGWGCAETGGWERGKGEQGFEVGCVEVGRVRWDATRSPAPHSQAGPGFWLLGKADGGDFPLRGEGRRAEWGTRRAGVWEARIWWHRSGPFLLFSLLCSCSLLFFFVSVLLLSPSVYRHQVPAKVMPDFRRPPQPHQNLWDTGSRNNVFTH